MTANAQDAIVLFGDSITQGGWQPGGFAQSLAYVYARKLDVVNRGLSGYNTEWALPVCKMIFPTKREQAHVPAMRLLIIWFGANDAVLPGVPQHVPLERFKENLVKMIKMVTDSQSDRYHAPAHILLITPPPIDVKGRAADLAARDPPKLCDRTWEDTKLYADAVHAVGKQEGVPVVDAWQGIWDAAGQKEENLPSYFEDGLHPTPPAYQVVYELIVNAIKKHWPELHYDNLPKVFPTWDAIDWNNPVPSITSHRVKV